MYIRMLVYICVCVCVCMYIAKGKGPVAIIETLISLIVQPKEKKEEQIVKLVCCRPSVI